MVTNNLFLNYPSCKYTPFSNQNKIFFSMSLFSIDFYTFVYVNFDIFHSRSFLNGIKTF